MKDLKNESGFFQHLKEQTLSTIFWERLELVTDSGFPDSHFVLRKPSTLTREGTVEFKYQRDHEKPNLAKLMRGDQKVNFMDYLMAGGQRRFVLVGNMAGKVFLYSTERAVAVLRGTEVHPSSSASWEDKAFPVRHWLPSMLGMNW